MKNTEREQVWQARVAQWQASGLSQRAYAMAVEAAVDFVFRLVEMDMNRCVEFARVGRHLFKRGIGNSEGCVGRDAEGNSRFVAERVAQA